MECFFRVCCACFCNFTKIKRKPGSEDFLNGGVEKEEGEGEEGEGESPDNEAQKKAADKVKKQALEEFEEKPATPDKVRFFEGEEGDQENQGLIKAVAGWNKDEPRTRDVSMGQHGNTPIAKGSGDIELATGTTSNWRK